MKNIIKAAIVATAFTATSASAWWDMPFFGDGLGDGYGNGDMSFNMNARANAHTSARGYGYGYNNPYYGYAPYGYAPYGYAPIAPVAPQTEAR